MTYYSRQVELLSAELYANIYLVKRVIQAKYFIDKNFDQAIDLDTICKEACISKFHLIRSFKKLYGVTPYQHLTFLRIKKVLAIYGKRQKVQRNKSSLTKYLIFIC